MYLDALPKVFSKTEVLKHQVVSEDPVRVDLSCA